MGAWRFFTILMGLFIICQNGVSPSKGLTTSPSILEAATPVTNGTGWAADDNVTDYYWLSENGILFIQWATGNSILWRYNLGTKVETEVTGPNSELIELEAGPFVSPDGRWLLGMWPGGDVFPWQLSHTATNLWKAQGTIVGWLNDSLHWMELGKTQAFIRSVKSPAYVQRIRLPRTSALLRQDINNQYQMKHVRCLSKTLFLAHTDLTRNVVPLHGIANVDVYAGRLDATAKHTRHYSFHTPTGYKIFDAVFSPDGAQVAWLLQSPTTGRVSLRVSRLNLSDMHELGTLEDTVTGKEGPYLAGRYQLKWLPNGKRLSFLYQKTLWTVPVSLQDRAVGNTRSNARP